MNNCLLGSDYFVLLYRCIEPLLAFGQNFYDSLDDLCNGFLFIYLFIDISRILHVLGFYMDFNSWIHLVLWKCHGLRLCGVSPYFSDKNHDLVLINKFLTCYLEYYFIVSFDPHVQILFWYLVMAISSFKWFRCCWRSYCSFQWSSCSLHPKATSTSWVGIPEFAYIQRGS